MRVGLRRALIALAVLAAVAVIGPLLAVHTPWARERALTWAADFVTRYDLSLKAGTLRYNAVTRRITLTDVRLAAEGHEARPFLIANRIEVKLPWMVYRGRFAIDHLEIENGIVDIFRDANDVVNLPPGSTRPTPETPRRLSISGLTLKGLDVQYADVLRNWGIKVPRIASNLTSTPLGAEGAFAVRGEIALRLRERTMTMAPFETVMSFDGSNVALKDARLNSSEINAFISGPIHRVLDAPALELSIKGGVNLDNAMKWVPPAPVAVGGLATIEGTISGPVRTFVTDLHVASNTLTLGHERDITVSGPVRVTFGAFSGDNFVLKPAGGGEIRAQFNVPWNGEDVTKAAAEWKNLDAQAAFRLGEITPQKIGAAFDGSGTFEFGEPRRFTIANRATARSGRGLVPITGTENATLVGDDYRVDHSHRLPGLALDGRLSGRINRGPAALSTVQGPAHAQISDLAEAAGSLESLGIAMPEITRRIHGPLDAPMTIAGTYRAPQVETRVSSEALDLPFVGRVRASAEVKANTREASIAAIDVRQGTATVTGSVLADITNRTWDGQLHVDAPNAEELQMELPEEWRVIGPIVADAKLGGTFDSFQLDTTIGGSSLTFAGQQLDRVDARAIVTAEAIDVSSLEIRQGAGYLAGQVQYAWESSAYQAKLKGDRLFWQGSLLSPNDTQAIFSIAFEGAGTVAQPKGQASIDFALTGGTAGTLIGAGDVTVDLLGEQARVVARLPSIGALINADVATASPFDYRVNAQLDRLELARLSPLIGAIEAEILGFATGTVTASGRFADARDRVAFVNLTELDAGIGGVPVTLNAPINLTLRDEEITLKDLFLRVGSGRLTASGQWTTGLAGNFQGQFAGDLQDAIRLGKAFGGPATLDGRGPLFVDLKSTGTRAGTVATLALKNGSLTWGESVNAVQDLNVDASLNGESLTVSRIAGNVATGGVVGSFSATARAELPTLELAAIDGELIVDAAKFTFSGIPVEQQRPSRVEFASGTMAVADVSWLVANNPLIVGGSVGFAAEDPTLNLSVKGLVDLRVLSAFAGTIGFDGDADVNTLIAGTLAKPVFDGRITLDGAEMAISEPRLVLSELSGPIVLDGDRVVFDGVRGLANGGNLALDGTLQVEGAAIVGGEMNIQAQSVAIEMPRGLRSELDALITYRPDPKAPSITGDIRVVQSAYTETITIAALARRSSVPASPTVDRPYLDRLRLNLVVTTTEDVVVDNNYGRLAAGANVRVVGTVAEPGMTGRITLREGGEIYLAGRTFRVTRGDISFTDLRRIQPEFNIAAEAPIGRDNVILTLTGTPERPSVDLASEEGSRTPGELAAAIVGESNTDTALTLLSADLLGVTGRAIGLSAFRLERGDFEDPDFRDDPSLIGTDRTDPTTRLTLSKRLSDQVEFTVSQNLRDSGETTFVISYFIRPNIELRGLSRDNSTIGFGIRHQITFGEGTSQPRTERRVRPIVNAITFTGIDAATEAEARSKLGLDPGDEFDFLELQRDVDDVREMFHQLGHLEARVRTRRAEGEAPNTVNIEFRVERGPRTELQIVGATLPQSEIAELEEAWHRNVFDQFLIDDLTHRVRRYLVTTNELGSVVVGTISRPAEDLKRFRIDITPGASVTGREIRFTGNQHFDAKSLNTEITAAGLDIEAWLDRTVVERQLRTVYHEAGFLKVQIVAEPLTIDNTTGVLPISIVEGPRAQITTLRWAGVADDRLPAVQKAANLATPSPFVSKAVSDARTRIEEHYRDQGFNSAEVNAETEVADDDTATLTFTVTENPQQILHEVETTGLEITNGKVLTQALRFELGKPVDLDAWAVARKRLYDTNVFRQVEIQPVPIGDPVNGIQPVKAVVTVQEYPAWTFRYGLQLEGQREVELDEFTSTRNLGVVGELRNPNLLGRALTSALFASYEYDSRDVTMLLATSRLFGWRARSTLYGFVSRDRIRDDLGEEIVAITQREGVSADQRWRTRGMQIVYGYRFERNRTYDPDPGNDPIPFDVIANLAKLSGAVLLDRRDDPINARRGTFSSISFDNSALWLGSDVSNRKLLMQQYVFLPVGGLVLASRVQAGKAFGRDDLLPSDRFLAGGATTVRGYGEDSLGPRNLIGVPAGGDALLILNQELRFPIRGWLKGVTFLDAGNVFGPDQSLSWRDLRLGYGIGLRLDSPVGLLRVDFGIPNSRLSPSSREPNTLKSGRAYFGLGHIF